MTFPINDAIFILINKETNKSVKHHYDNKEELYIGYKRCTKIKVCKPGYILIQ